MPVGEAGHDATTIGVEEEFLLVDGSGRLSRRGPELVGQAQSGAADADLQEELASCQVETATSVCHGAEEILGQLRDRRREFTEEALAKGLRLLPSGSPILAEEGPPEITPNERYRRMDEHFGAITDTSTTCGCHVHVAVRDRETGVQVSNRIRPWLPVLLALNANSPFNDGTDTSYASWRYVLWSRWPSAGPPPLFASLDHYESSVEALLRAEAMLDRGMVYWDIRLSEDQPTLEFRVCDVSATPEEAALVAALIRGLVVTALDDIEGRRPAPDLPLEVLNGNLWRAARDGLAGRCLHPITGELVPVRDQVRQLVDRLRPVLRANGDLEFVEWALAALEAAGNGAQRQRAAFAAEHRLEAVVDLLAAHRPLREFPS
jgi:carboxylate-amine ligase